jgi:uncharacterized protein (DUF885 family)
MKRISFAILLALLSFAAASVHAAAPSFDEWADGFAAEWIRTKPQLATRTQYFSGAEQDAIDRQLGLSGVFGNPYGLSAAQAAAKLAQSGLTELQRFPVAAMSPQQRTSAASISWMLLNAIRSADFAQNRPVFDQFNGLHVVLVTFMTTTHPIRNQRDAENYLARLALVGTVIDQGISEAKAAGGAGVLPPRFIIERLIEQLNAFLAPNPADNVLVTTFATRLAALGAALPTDERAKFVAAAEQETGETVRPAFARVRAMLEAQLPSATDDAGVWRLPHGDATYAQALNTFTTTTLSADEIHAVGLREVARIEAEMDRILQQLGYPDGSVKERYETFNATLQLPAQPDPRPILVARADAIVQDAARRSAAVFDLRPSAPVTVKREPAFSEQGAAAHYSAPAPDGTIPGIYWMPLADLGPKVTWLGAGMRSTAYHEAIPGHHFQIALQQESRELPRYRKLGVFGFVSAFGEGWALYAERLAEENGWYDDDQAGRLGYLQAQLFRARRLVADTGLHAKHWTRQQVIDYGFTPAEAERYVVFPGQACAYMIGQLRILELREGAKQALGPKFSIKEFHNVVLRGGAVPLDVLAQEVDAWVAANR